MPTPVPDPLRNALGDEGADALIRWLDDYLQDHAVRRDEYREVLSRLDVLEERIVQLEQRFEQRFDEIDQRFERVDQRFGSVDDRLNQIDQRLDSIERGMRRQLRWSVGTIALFGTIVTILIAVAEFAG